MCVVRNFEEEKKFELYNGSGRQGKQNLALKPESVPIRWTLNSVFNLVRISTRRVLELSGAIKREGI